MSEEKFDDSRVVCRCEGLTWGSIQEAMADFHPTSLRQLKLLTRWGMGLCQGRICRPLMAITEFSESTSTDLQLAARPPHKPLAMAAFIGVPEDRTHE